MVDIHQAMLPAVLLMQRLKVWNLQVWDLHTLCHLHALDLQKAILTGTHSVQKGAFTGIHLLRPRP